RHSPSLHAGVRLLLLMQPKTIRQTNLPSMAAEQVRQAPGNEVGDHEGAGPRISAPKVVSVVLVVMSLLLFVVGCGTSFSNTIPNPSIAAEEWRSVDIGDQVASGKTVFDDDSLVVEAAGVDVWNTSDSFRYIYHPLSGDGKLTVLVDSMSAAHEWTKVGVMVREDLDASARNAFLLLTDFNGVLFQRRESLGGPTNDVLPDGTYMRDYAATAPWWLQLERTRNQ